LIDWKCNGNLEQISAVTMIRIVDQGMTGYTQDLIHLGETIEHRPPGACIWIMIDDEKVDQRWQSVTCWPQVGYVGLITPIWTGWEKIHNRIPSGVTAIVEWVDKEQWPQFWGTGGTYPEMALIRVDGVPIPSPNESPSGAKPHSRTMNSNNEGCHWR
jgi:hypothetical protein